MSSKDQLFEILLEDERDEHKRRFISEFANRDPDRMLILNAQLVAERMVEDMLELSLVRPKVWLKNADFRSNQNLAYALGLIGDHELACCRVLSRARNSIAHQLGPLPDKWRRELDKLTQRAAASEAWKEVPVGLNKTLCVLLAALSHAWSHVKFNYHWRQLRDVHGERWVDIYVEKAKEARANNLELPDEQTLKYEIDLQLAKELREAKKR